MSAATTKQWELITMNPLKPSFALILVCGILAAGIARGDETTPPQAIVQNGITYLSGGIGEDQVQAMRAESKNGYNLQLVFATVKTGQYKANVNVTIANEKGVKLVDAVAVGPGFYAKLPNGHYRIVAEAQGTQQSKTIYVTGNNLTRYVLYWAAEPGEMSADTH